jgi:nucleoside-diphosphate-sugar epimerase
VHCAARAHMIQKKQKDYLNAYWRINVDGAKDLTKHAVGICVRRFIFLSW